MQRVFYVWCGQTDEVNKFLLQNRNAIVKEIQVATERFSDGSTKLCALVVVEY